LCLQAGGGSVELFKSDDNDVGSFSSSNVSVRLGKFSDGQIVCGDEVLQIEPFDVAADSKEVYLIAKEKSQSPPAAPITGVYVFVKLLILGAYLFG